MQRSNTFFWLNTHDGGLLIEAMMAIVVFGLFVGASYTTLLIGQEGTRNGSNRIRGIHLNHQAIDAVRSIRNESYDLLPEGTHGFTIDPDSGRWTLTGSSLERYGYTTRLQITDISATVKHIEATTSWDHGLLRNGTAYLSTYVTNWRTDVGVGDWSNITQVGSWFSGTNSDFNDIVRYKDYVYITDNGASANGSGLVILDVSDTANPVAVATDFSINEDVYSPIVSQDFLYVAVDASNDVRVYTVATPTALNSGTTPLDSDTLPGGPGRARSLAIYDSTLLVGATGHSGQDELYSYDISTGGTLTMLDSVDLLGDPDVYDIFVKDNIAYLGAGDSQIISIDISDPSNLSIITSRLMGYQQATGVRANGTGYYVTMLNGTDEVSLRTGTGTAGVPGGDIADLHGRDLGNNANSLDMDHNGCYAFVATGNGSRELQILDATSLNLTELAINNVSDTGEGRAIHYDVINDQLFMGTSSGVYIYSPGPPTTCI